MKYEAFAFLQSQVYNQHACGGMHVDWSRKLSWLVPAVAGRSRRCKAMEPSSHVMVEGSEAFNRLRTAMKTIFNVRKSDVLPRRVKPPVTKQRRTKR